MPVLRIAPIAELPAMRAQPVAERALVGREMLRCFAFTRRQAAATALRAPASATRRACLTVFSRSLRRSRASEVIVLAPQFTSTGPWRTASMQLRLLALDPGLDFRGISQRAALERYGLNLGLQQPCRALDRLRHSAGYGVDFGLDVR